jgi:hypothetical protein
VTRNSRQPRALHDPGVRQRHFADEVLRPFRPVVYQGPGVGENNEQGKDLIGIDQHQVRTWTAWHHTITVCMFAHAVLAVQHADLHRDTTTSASDPATGPGKAAAHNRPARQAPTG